MKTLKLILSWLFVLVSCKESFAMTAEESINKFTFNAAGILRENSEEYFFSPYSILSAFGMAYAGAEGNTAREIEESLGFSSEIHAELGNFLRDVEKEDALSSANRVWLRNGLALKDAYKEILLMNYNSTAQELDFKNDTENSRKIINKWVSEKTHEKIPELIGQLEAATQMVLTNAVYFNAEWASKFSKKLTSKEKFTYKNCCGEKTFDVDMMKKRGDFLFAEKDGNKIIRLPYSGGRFSMIAVLPPKDEDLKIDADIFSGWLRSLEEYEVDLWLPKFKTEKRYEIKDLFESLGIKLAFSNSADFSGITDDEKLKIDKIIHQTFIDVDEEKTEAAAATAVMMVKATAMPMIDKPFAEFRADRPFEYFIVDDYTKIILFAGRQTFAERI